MENIIFDRIYHKRLDKNLLEDYDKDEAKIAEIKRFIGKLLLSKNLNFLIGSGCSIDAIPLMGATFKKVKSKLDKSTLGEFSDSNDIEGYLNWLISAINFHDGDKKKKFQQSFNQSIDALVESMPSFESYNQNESLANEVSIALKNYQLFYNAVFTKRDNSPIPLAPINIFTTNYDLFNENALDNINIHYSSGFQGGMKRVFNPSMFNLRYVDTENKFKMKWNPVRRFAKLYKLHGSTNWISEDDKIYLTDRVVKSTDQVMIYPSYVKHDITNQTPYSELFRELTLNLQKPNSVLIVLGFGFPDEHINQLIEQALNNEDFILLIFGDDEETNIQSFYNRNKMKPNIHLIGGNYRHELEKGKLHYFENVIQEFLISELNMLDTEDNELEKVDSVSNTRMGEIDE